MVLGQTLREVARVDPEDVPAVDAQRFLKFAPGLVGGMCSIKQSY